ncbi:MAG TPA: nuclear transport factor 2 family protein [Terriglobales bacterium]|nr:nuclear transport factor 2 family protein [Terriglobales bacterium]
MSYCMYLILSVCLFNFAAHATANCARAELQHQAKDVAAVQRLEKAWSMAYLTGDADFEECLLTSDFTEIFGDGSIKHLEDELALARNNKGKNLAIPALPTSTVLLHGNVAAAHGMSESKGSDGKTHHRRFVDYYVWEHGRWRVYFAQQTLFAD